MSREEAKRAAEAAGARVASSVSRRTEVVVAGRDPGGKLEKARSLGGEAVDERESLHRLRGTARTPMRERWYIACFLCDQLGGRSGSPDAGKSSGRQRVRKSESQLGKDTLKSSLGERHEGYRAAGYRKP